MREDMDSIAMVHRAYANSSRLDSYDPHHLIAEVQELLQARGLDPDLPPGTGRAGMALGAAGMLLRAFGILPASDHTAIDRVTAPDPDSR